MIDIKQLSELQKKSKTSFAEQRQLLKKVMAGNKVLCTTCHQPILLIPPQQSSTQKTENSGIRCKKGCTDIQLDFV